MMDSGHDGNNAVDEERGDAGPADGGKAEKCSPRSIRFLDPEWESIEAYAETRGLAERFRPTPDYFLTVRGDSMDRTGLRDGDVVVIRVTPEVHNGDVVVARFGDEVTRKRFVRVDKRHVELRPDSHNPEHEPIRIGLAKHILHIDGVAVEALIGRLGSACQ